MGDSGKSLRTEVRVSNSHCVDSGELNRCPLHLAQNMAHGWCPKCLLNLTELTQGFPQAPTQGNSSRGCVDQCARYMDQCVGVHGSMCEVRVHVHVCTGTRVGLGQAVGWSWKLPEDAAFALQEGQSQLRRWSLSRDRQAAREHHAGGWRRVSRQKEQPAQRPCDSSSRSSSLINASGFCLLPHFAQQALHGSHAH